MNNGLLFNKTRIAPTPSGFVHLGNVLSFAITAALAGKTKARIVLRIDDNERDKINKSHVQDIFDTLNFLEIPWDEGPQNLWEYENEYSQLHRMDIYTKTLAQLKEHGNIFACTCSRSQVMGRNKERVYPGTCRHSNIPYDTANACWRLLTNNTKELSVKTMDGKEIITRLPAVMQDFIVKKKDGYPAYQLTSVLDDIYFGIDLVVRGEDLWPSTLAQHYLASVLQQDAFSGITFYHHPLLMAGDDKLSKTAGATSVQYYRSQHKKPADIYSMIARMLGIEATPANWQELTTLLDIKMNMQ